MLPLSIKQLEAFVAVAETGGFRRASDRLNLSQSAVTAHVKQLEETLGVPLLHRTTRTVTLTSAGENLLERARRTLAGVEDTLKTFRDEAAMNQGRVLIDCAPSFASSILPAALAAFQSAHPNIFVQVREAYGSEIIDALRNGAVDLGIGPFERIEKDLSFHELLQDSYVAVLPMNHRLATAKRVAFKDVVSEPVLAMPRRSATRRTLEAIFNDHGHVLAPKYEMLHHQTLISMAEAGLGIAILPETAVAPSPTHSYAVVRLSQPSVQRRMGILTLRGHRLSPAARTIADMLPAFVQNRTRADYSAA